MAPELAAAYLIGMVPSLAVTFLQARKYKQKNHSPATLQLQKNLSQVGKFWSEVDSGISELTEDSIEKEKRKSERTLWLMGLGFMFLSWGGFVFNLIIYISIHHLAISRFEQKIFASELVKQDLSAEDVMRVLTEVSL